MYIRRFTLCLGHFVGPSAAWRVLPPSGTSPDTRPSPAARRTSFLRKTISNTIGLTTLTMSTMARRWIYSTAMQVRPMMEVPHRCCCCWARDFERDFSPTTVTVSAAAPQQPRPVRMPRRRRRRPAPLTGAQRRCCAPRSAARSSPRRAACSPQLHGPRQGSRQMFVFSENRRHNMERSGLRTRRSRHRRRPRASSRPWLWREMPLAGRGVGRRAEGLAEQAARPNAERATFHTSAFHTFRVQQPYHSSSVCCTYVL